ncbi:MAG: hypothetical protein QNJ92_06765 [Alphaproteobacteria bacterium]|nr:hypothetical protein [Alphaproteobacteria bacterium]
MTKSAELAFAGLAIEAAGSNDRLRMLALEHCEQILRLTNRAIKRAEGEEETCETKAH